MATDNLYSFISDLLLPEGVAGIDLVVGRVGVGGVLLLEVPYLSLSEPRLSRRSEQL